MNTTRAGSNSTMDADALARTLDEAIAAVAATSQLSLTHDLTLDDAYLVQARGSALRARRGDPAVGVKLGFTSKAKAEQMGVSDLIIGVLHESMRLTGDDRPDVVTRWLHPRIEPEIAFRLGADIDTGDPNARILDAVSEVAPALEIIDSRYENFKFSLTDVVADNTSAAGFVIGEWLPLADAVAGHDLADLDVELRVGDELAASGSTADILGNPLAALDEALRLARAHGLPLGSGSIILAGAATAAVSLPAGARVVATVAGLGSVELTTA
ncbi:2-keto-4-pentenoate hydratase [Nocardia sp. R16R-3T]